MIREAGIDLYKDGRTIKCYIKEYLDVLTGKSKWDVCSGNPSDVERMAASYDNYREAKKSAMQLFRDCCFGKDPKIIRISYDLQN